MASQFFKENIHQERDICEISVWMPLTSQSLHACGNMEITVENEHIEHSWNVISMGIKDNFTVGAFQYRVKNLFIILLLLHYITFIKCTKCAVHNMAVKVHVSIKHMI